MEERHAHVVGLIGFIIAGLTFIAVGVRSQDALTVAGSVVWTLSCVVWLLPVLRPARSTG